MVKPRILMVNEFSGLNTGYSVYGKELLTRLHKKYEVAELAAYIRPGEKQVNVPWKLYYNTPPKNSPENNAYEAKGTNQFGEFMFDKVCAEFKPHIVIDIRDHWMFSYQEHSPARNYFHWMIMPTCDSSPQNEEWLSTFANADSVFTYNDWSKSVLKKASNGMINLVGSASPAASDDFFPLSKEGIKKQFGFQDYFIFGTVMRNQKRKLYPDLFSAFRKFLDNINSKSLLYCHTSYPDMGWDIPNLLLEYNLSSKVLFTYKCRNCGNIYPSLFADGLAACISCNNLSCGLVNVNDGVENKILNMIYNMFDFYIQPSNSEGFGMPQVEAAAAGTPIITTEYSAMEDIGNKLESLMMEPVHLLTEQETGCKRAILTPQEILNKMILAYNTKDIEKLRKQTRKNFLEHYGSWDRVVQKWIDVIDKVDIEKYEQKWNSPKKIHNIPLVNEEQVMSMGNTEYARFLVKDVLGKPEKVGSYMMQRLIRDLNVGCTPGGINGVYYTENAFKVGRTEYFPIDRKQLFQHFVELRQYQNDWEHNR